MTATFRVRAHMVRHFINWILRPIVTVLVGQTVLQTLHLCGLYPDMYLAELAASVIKHPPADLTIWAQLALTVVFGVAALFFYEIVMRRWFRPAAVPSLLSPSEILMARAKTVAKDTAGRLAYVRTVLDQNKENELRKWLRKADDQRIDFQHIIPPKFDGFTSSQITALEDSRTKHMELERCINNIIEKSNYETLQQAAGLYAHRLSKFSVALSELIEALENPVPAKEHGQPARSRKSEDPYDNTVKWALHYLASETEFAGEIDGAVDELRQAARSGAVTIYGRPDSGSLAADGFYKPIEPIPANHWRDFGLDALRCIFHEDARECRTEPDNSNNSSNGETYVDLRVVSSEVTQRWPQRRE